MSEQIELIRGGYEAFAQLDIDGVLSRFADTMTWTVPPLDDWGGTFKGRDEILGFFGSLPGRYGFFEVRPKTFLQDGDHVIVLGAHVFEDGEEIPFAHAWTVDELPVARNPRPSIVYAHPERLRALRAEQVRQERRPAGVPAVPPATCRRTRRR